MLKKGILKNAANLTDNVLELIFISPESLDFEPGQFITIKVDDNLGPCYRAYSVADYNRTDNEFKLIVKIVPNGRGSTYLNNLKEGEEISFTGPSGRFVLENDSSSPIIMLCTGTGIVPFLAFLKTINNREAKLMWGLRAEKDIFYSDVLDSFTNKLHNFSYDITFSKPENESFDGMKGRITSHIDKYEKDFDDADFYLCGNGNMIDEVSKILEENGVKKEKIRYEKF